MKPSKPKSKFLEPKKVDFSASGSGFKIKTGSGTANDNNKPVVGKRSLKPRLVTGSNENNPKDIYGRDPK